jgi:hypothetical protein
MAARGRSSTGGDAGRRRPRYRAARIKRNVDDGPAQVRRSARDLSDEELMAIIDRGRETKLIEQQAVEKTASRSDF